MTRRFVCDAPQCRRRMFAERFGDDVLPERSSRTSRLDCTVHHLGLPLGGGPAASLAKRLMLPVSNDTLLRVVRRCNRPRSSQESRHCYHRSYRNWRANPCSGPPTHRPIPHHDPQRDEAELDPWIIEARASLIASFASGIGKDKAAVHAAIIESWSNGQTEGQITKLKLVKRQMYGRAKMGLLQARLIGAV